MGATRLEYRFRFLVHAVIYFLGFTLPWCLPPSWQERFDLSSRSTWLVLSSRLALHGWLSFQGAVWAILIVALVFTALGAWLRTWGAAYVGAGVVHSQSMHGQAMLADGPYRRTRNPLYLGTLLHTIGISLLMTPTGLVVAIGLLWIFQVRLALAEEPFLAGRFGQPYMGYKTKVPRFLPALTPQVPAAGARPHWGLAVMGEFYFIAAFGALAVLGWQFNARPLQRALLISLGVWIVLRGFLPKPAAVSSSTTA